MEISVCFKEEEFVEAGYWRVEAKNVGRTMFSDLKGMKTVEYAAIDLFPVSLSSIFADSKTSYAKADSAVKICKRYHMRHSFKEIEYITQISAADKTSADWRKPGFECGLIDRVNTIIGGRKDG